MKTIAASSLALACAMLAPTHARADARDEVIAAFDTAMAQKTYHVTMTSQVRGKPYETRTAVELPATFHMTTPDSETVITPRGSWMRTGGDEWMRMPMDMSGMVKNISFEAMKGGPDMLRDVQATGDSSDAGCDANDYSYRTQGKVMGFKANSTVQLSVCKDTGLPAKLVTTDAKGKNSTTLRYDFTTPVEIRAPR